MFGYNINIYIVLNSYIIIYIFVGIHAQ